MRDLLAELEEKQKQTQQPENDLISEAQFRANQNVERTMANAAEVKRLQEEGNTPAAFMMDIGYTLNRAIPNLKRLVAGSDDPEAIAALQEIEQKQDLLRTAFPTSVFGGDVALPAMTALAALPLGFASGITAGASEAALSSTSESNPRTQAAIAAAAPVAISGIGKVGSGALELAQNALKSGGDVISPTPTQQAARYIGRYMDEASLTPEDALRQRSQLGEGSVLADVPSMRGISQDVATEPAGRQWIEAFQDRQAESGTRVINRMSEAIGKDPSDFASNRVNLISQRASRGKELYNQALLDEAGNPLELALPPTESTAKLISRLNNSGALKEAQDIANISGENFSGGQTLYDMHLAKQALFDMETSARRAGQNGKANSYKALRDDLVNQIDEVSPAYKVARMTYSDDSSIVNALDLGENVFTPKLNGERLTFDELKTTVDNMPPVEFESFQLGVSKAIRDKLESVPETADSAARIWKRSNIKNAVRLAFKDDAQFNQFLEGLKVESAFTDTLNDLFRGSQTAQRTAAKQSRASGGFGFKEVTDRLLGRNVSPEGMAELSKMIYDKNTSNEAIRMALINSGVYDETLPNRAVGYMRKNWDMIFNHYNDKAFKTGPGIGITAAQYNEAQNDKTN
jgi:hypothetical protein